MILYIAIYLLTMGLCILETNIKYVEIGTRKVRTAAFSFVVIYTYLLLLGICRGELLGVDSLNYKNNYWEVYKNLNWIGAIQYDSDWGYGIINWIVSRFTSDFWVFRAILYTLTFTLISLWIWKHSKNIALSFFIFISLGHVGFEFTLVRQALAASFFVWSYDFILERKPVKFLLMTVFASFFHKTALIMLVVYPLLGRKIKDAKIWLKLVYFVGVFSITMIGGQAIAVLYHRNDYSTSLNAGHGYHLLLFYVVLFSVLAFYKSKTKKDTLLDDEYELAFSSIYFQVIATAISIITRVLKYSTPYLFVLTPDILERLDSKTKNSMLAVLICILTVLYCATFTSGDIVPYISHWM